MLRYTPIVIRAIEEPIVNRYRSLRALLFPEIRKVLGVLGVVRTSGVGCHSVDLIVRIPHRLIHSAEPTPASRAVRLYPMHSTGPTVIGDSPYSSHQRRTLLVFRKRLHSEFQSEIQSEPQSELRSEFGSEFWGSSPRFAGNEDEEWPRIPFGDAMREEMYLNGKWISLFIHRWHSF